LKIALVTVARSDFGRLLPTLKKLQDDPKLELQLLVTGNHCMARYGNSVSEIQKSGIEIREILEVSEDAVQRSSEILSGTGKFIQSHKPDFMLILGDRYEMLAVAQAAFLNAVPIIHIGGGYTTLGAIDDKVRHAISHLSTYHFVASQGCLEKLRSFGISEHLYLNGAPDLEILNQVETISKEQFCEQLNLPKGKPFVLVTLHPETCASHVDNRKFCRVFKSYLETQTSVLMTAPCADPGSEEVFKIIEELKGSASFVFRESLGVTLFVNALRHCEYLIGNSSSGIIEAASTKTPVVNVGARQAGRERNPNVIDCEFTEESISQAVSKCVNADFKKQLDGRNIYGDGSFSENFIKALRTFS
jgi:GDP/UDP-N,N'-diacetylbacillosamine 2-epimerase (hydrolysing)